MPTAKLKENFLPKALLPADRPQHYLNILEKDIHEGKFQEYWQVRENTHRLTYNFGYDYFQMRESDYTYVPIPPYLADLCRECLEALGMEATSAKDYDNIIVSYYKAGDRLEPHFDVDISWPVTGGQPVNFYFGEDVIGVVLEPDAAGRFYLLDPNGQVLEELDEKAGMVFLLSGEVRRQPYRHGVSVVQESRVSVTFRTVHRL